MLAVSGGVDSMVLLDLLVTLANSQKSKAQSSEGKDSFQLSTFSFQLIVAHLDHGIRPDSDIDRQLVRQVATRHGLVFVYDKANLGPDASEATARKARYDFLRRVRQATGADAVVTAHHQDDLLETAILNLLRGTGRKGLSSLGDNKHLRRPLLHVSKNQLIEYAKKHGLKWREDVTNQNMKHRRNYVRENIVKKLTPKQREELTELLIKTKVTNETIDTQIAKLLQFTGKDKDLDRRLFIALPHAVAREVMAAWLRQNNIRQFDKKLLEKLVTGSKTLAPGKQIDVNVAYRIKVAKDKLALNERERYFADSFNLV